MDAASTTDPLVTLLYVLLRDHLPAGVLEKAVQDIDPKVEIRVLSNEYLAKYAEDLAGRLRTVQRVPDPIMIVREPVRGCCGCSPCCCGYGSPDRCPNNNGGKIP